MERPGEPRKRRSNRKSAEKAAQSLLALLMLSTASGCATYDVDRIRPIAAKSRPHLAKTAFYVVARGDTLSSIARQFGVTREAIAEINQFDDPDSLMPGRRILIPKPGSRTRYAGRVSPGYNDAVARPPRRSATPPARGRDLDAPAEEIDPRLVGAKFYAFDGPRTKPGDDRPVEEDVRYSSAIDLDAPYEPPSKSTKASTVSKHAGNFIWPVRGRVISPFGGDNTGQRNDGINIAADAGTPVKASEGGVVIYAGNELSSYGNLLLIRHPSGYVTAYAHNKKLLVKKNEKVKRGQQIAAVGETGSVDKPQLHFEIRKGNKPVNPNDYLITATASR